MSDRQEKHPIVRELEAITDGVLKLAGQLASMENNLAIVNARNERLEDEVQALKAFVAGLMESHLELKRQTDYAQKSKLN